MKTVSAVVITYKRPEPLVRAIRSIAEQSVKPAELIVVDNACEKSIHDLVLSLAPDIDFPVRYFPEHKRGLPAARNRGIKEAKFEYVAFLDDDDLWLPDHLENFHRICSVMENVALFAGYLARFGDSQQLILPEDDRLFKDYDQEPNADWTVRRQSTVCRPFYVPGLSASLIEVSRARKVMFDEDLIARADIYFVWNLAQTGDVVLHEQTHALADQMESSLASVSRDASEAEIVAMSVKREYYGVMMLEKWNSQQGVPVAPEMRRGLGAAYFDSAYANTRAGNWKQAVILTVKSLRIRPELRHLKLLLRIAFGFLEKKLG